MASNATASNTCTSSTMSGQHAGWGQSVTIELDGVARTVARPDGWWEEHGDEPWSFSVTFDDPAGVWSWADHEASRQVQGGGVLELSAACTTTTTTVLCQEDDPCFDCETMGNRICGPLVSTPAVVVDPSVPPSLLRPTPPLPAGVELTVTTVDPSATLPPGVTTSVLPNGDVAYSDCVVVMACDDPRFAEPTSTVAVVSKETLPVTGGVTDGLPWVGAVFLIVGAVAMFGARRDGRYHGRVSM